MLFYFILINFECGLKISRVIRKVFENYKLNILILPNIKFQMRGPMLTVQLSLYRLATRGKYTDTFKSFNRPVTFLKAENGYPLSSGLPKQYGELRAC